MAHEIGALRVAVNANTAQFEADLGAAKAATRQAADDMRNSAENAAKGFSTITKAVLALGAQAVAVTGKLAIMVKKQIDAADAAAKTAQKVGMSVESFTALNHAADLSGLSTEQFATAMKQLNKNLVEAQKGTKNQVDAFKALGIEVEKENGELKSAEEILFEISDAFGNAEDGAGKTAVAMALMGKSGSDMIPMLNGGSDALNEMMQEARDLGLTIDDETSKAAEQFNDDLTRLKGAGTGFINDVMKEMLPMLVDLSELFVGNAKEGRKMGESVSALTNFLKGAVTVGATLKMVFATVGKVIAGVAAAVMSVLDGDFSGAKSVLSHMWSDLIDEADKYQQTVKVIWDTERKIVSGSVKLPESENDGSKKQIVFEGDDDKKKSGSKKRTAVDAINEQIKALELQAATFGMAEKEAVLYKMAIQGATDAQLEQADVILTVLAQKQAEIDLQEEAQAVYDATRTAQEQYNAEMERLNELLAAGAINYDTFERAAEQAMERLKKSTEDTEDVFKDLEDAINGWGKNSADAFVDFAMTGEASFSDLVDSIIQDIMRMLVYESLLKPMFGSLSLSGGGAGAGLGSMLGGLFGGARATGGNVDAGKFYKVNELGPELLTVGNQQFLMMGDESGSVTPNSELDTGAASGQPPVQLRIINSLDPSVVNDWASSASGEQAIMNIITNNSATIKAALQ